MQRSLNPRAAPFRPGAQAHVVVSAAPQRRRRMPRRSWRPRRQNRRNNWANVRSRNIPNISKPRQSGPRTDNLVISKKEKWFNVENGVNKYTFLPGSSGIPHLDRFALIHENYQLRYFRIDYMPSSGTTIPGNITMGVDYAPQNDRKREDIPLLDPNKSGTIYSPSNMRVIMNRSQKGISWLQTTAAGATNERDSAFALYIDADTEQTSIGQIWVTYKVAFSTATSPSGVTPSANKISIVTTTQELAGDVSISQPTSLIATDSEQVDLLQLEEPPHTTAANEEESTVESSVKISEKILPGTEFTMGSALTTPSATSSLRAPMMTSAPKITFKYANGNTVPNTVIAPVNRSPKIQFSSQAHQSDLFAGLFKVLQNLVEPVIGVVEQVIQPFLGRSTIPLEAEETSLLEVPTENLTTFAFIGDDAVITLPNLAQDSISSKIPLTIMIAGGKRGQGYRDTPFVKMYDYNKWSHPSGWVASVNGPKSPAGEDPNENIHDYMWVNLQHPDIELGKQSSFQLGDIILLYFNVIQMDTGIGTKVKTPYAVSIPTNTLELINKRITESYLISAKYPDIPSWTPKLKIIESSDQTQNDKAGEYVGYTVVARFESSEPTSIPEDVKFEIAQIQLPVGHFISALDGSKLFENEKYNRPDKRYINGLLKVTLQAFPTASDEKAETSKTTYYSVGRINKPIKAETKDFKLHRLTRSEDVVLESDEENSD